jgi:SPFH domain / Band 7 family
MANSIRFGLLSLISVVSLVSTGCSSGAIFGVTSWETLSAGEVAAVYHGSGSEKDTVDLYTGKFNYGPFDRVLTYTTGQHVVDFSARTDQGTATDQSIHFKARNVSGQINVQVLMSFENTQDSIGRVAKELRVNEEGFKKANLYASTQAAVINVTSAMDPATINSQLPQVATSIKDALQKEYGKMVKIHEVRITSNASFGEAFDKQLAQQAALQTATDNEASKRKLIQAQKLTREAEAANIKAVDPSIRDYQLKAKELEIKDKLADKGVSGWATGVTLSPSPSK